MFEKDQKTKFWSFSNTIFYADSFEAVFTYKIRRNEVGIIMNKAVAVKPKILTSIKSVLKFLEICLWESKRM